MLQIYKSVGKGLVEVDKVEDGVWVNMTEPNESEIESVARSLKMDPDFLRAALDEEERSRIEYDDETDQMLIVVDVPEASFEHDKRKYATLPVGIVFTDKCIVTVCLRENIVLQSFVNNSVKTFFTYKKSRFILQILYKNAAIYLQYLKQIDKQSSQIENELHRSMKNKELIQLLDLEKSLVYFSTSLKSNELVMEKLMRYDFIRKYPEDQELLEDTIIENKQAIEMAKIYSDILSGTMDAFASIISNNLNIVMKFLTSVTIVMAIPTMISSFFGMNVAVPLAGNRGAFWWVLLIAVLLCALAAYWMNKKKMF